MWDWNYSNQSKKSLENIYVWFINAHESKFKFMGQDLYAEALSQ